MSKSKGMQLGALLMTVIIVSITFTVASSAPVTDSKNGGNAIAQEVKLSDDQRTTVVTNIANESGIGELPMPVFREDVIVYFKEMPDMGAFASKYRGKIVFIKPDIKMAAFETNPTGRTEEVSQETLDFINEVSKDPRVEKAYHDGFMFTRPDKIYSPEPKITYPEDLEKQGVKREYILNKVLVGFWRFPPSLEEFASKHNGKLVGFDDANEALMYASFETNDVSGFIRSVSTDPYVSSASPDANYYSLA